MITATAVSVSPESVTIHHATGSLRIAREGLRLEPAAKNQWRAVVLNESGKRQGSYALLSPAQVHTLRCADVKGEFNVNAKPKSKGWKRAIFRTKHRAARTDDRVGEFVEVTGYVRGPWGIYRQEFHNLYHLIDLGTGLQAGDPDDGAVNLTLAQAKLAADKWEASPAHQAKLAGGIERHLNQMHEEALKSNA